MAVDHHSTGRLLVALLGNFFNLAYTPIVDPWPQDQPIPRSRPTLEETLEDIREDIASIREDVDGEFGFASERTRTELFPDEYKEKIYDDEWAQREVDEISYFFRRLGVGTFIAVYVIFGNRWSDRISRKVKLPLVYDPEKITAYFSLRPEKVAIRFMQIVYEAMYCGLGAAYDNLSFNLSKDFRAYRYLAKKVLRNAGIHLPVQTPNTGKTSERLQREEEYWERRYQKRAAILRASLTRLGPAFVKFGQLLGSRPDIVGTRMIRELQRLQDDIPFFPNELAYQFIREELGADPDRIFQNLSKRPVAAASLGQVYKAKLDDIDIAVKVQRPGMVESIALDFFILRRLSRIFGRYWGSKTDPAALIDEYAMRLFDELDYVRESENMAKFRGLYGQMPGIYIPRVFSKYSTRHVLVMEWVDGEKLVDDTASIKPEDVPLVEVGIRCGLNQLLQIGFLHADPHAGNLIKTRQGRLAYLDFGLVSVVPEYIRNTLLCAILHLINREYQLLAEDFSNMSIIQAYDVDLELAEFSKALMDEFEPLMANGMDGFTFIGVAEKLLRLATQYPLVFPAYFVSNIRALATLEGLALTADPKFRIFRIIYPFVVQRVLYDSNEMLKCALREMVVDQDGAVRWSRLAGMVNDADIDAHLSATGLANDGNAQVPAIASVNVDSLMSFVISPGGRSVRRILVSQLAEDLNFRIQRSIDRMESIILPPHIRPPERCIGVCADVQYILRLKENRRRVKQLLKRVGGIGFLTMLQLVPLFIVNIAGISFTLIARILVRMLRDTLYVILAIARGANFMSRRDAADSLPKKASAAEASRASAALEGPAATQVASNRSSSGAARAQRAVDVKPRGQGGNGVPSDRRKPVEVQARAIATETKQTSSRGGDAIGTETKQTSSQGGDASGTETKQTSSGGGNAIGTETKQTSIGGGDAIGTEAKQTSRGADAIATETKQTSSGGGDAIATEIKQTSSGGGDAIATETEQTSSGGNGVAPRAASELNGNGVAPKTASESNGNGVHAGSGDLGEEAEVRSEDATDARREDYNGSGGNGAIRGDAERSTPLSAPGKAEPGRRREG